ncbi:MAG: hypothetical protein ACRED0_11995 [Gammaproteobacteria bacterium]
MDLLPTELPDPGEQGRYPEACPALREKASALPQKLAGGLVLLTLIALLVFLTVQLYGYVVRRRGLLTLTDGAGDGLAGADAAGVEGDRPPVVAAVRDVSGGRFGRCGSRSLLAYLQ